MTPAGSSVRSLESLCGQLIVGGFDGIELPQDYARALHAERRAGAILFRRNLGDLEATLGLCQRIARSSPLATPFIGIDEEGGRVRRLGAPVLRLPPMRQLGRAGDPALTESAARLLGAQLRALGFTIDFAPVLDVDTNPTNPVIGDRSFAADPDGVARHGGAFAAGLGQAGIMACGKHFPGHGDTALDSHWALPVVGHSSERLRRVELVPFTRLASRLPALMTAHVSYPALDALRPATTSPAILTGILRNQLRFTGVLFSDDLEMKALDGSIEERAVDSIRAGCDVVLICSNWERQERALEALIRTTERDRAFEERCQQARQRSLRARRSLGTGAPTATSLEELLFGEAAQRLEARLAELRDASAD